MRATPSANSSLSSSGMGLTSLRSSETDPLRIPSSPCCHQQTVVGILFSDALSSASQSLHSLIAVRFVAFLRIGRSCWLVVVVLVRRVVVIFVSINVLVVVVIVVTTPCGVVIVASVVDY